MIEMTIASLKNISYIAVFIAAVEYLHLDATAITVLAVLLVVDLFTGVIRAAVVEGPTAIRSKVAIRGFMSKALVFTVPFIIALAGRGVGIELTAIAASCVTVFILATLYSILGNIHSVSTGKPKSEFDALDFIIQKVRELLGKIIHEEV